MSQYTAGKLWSRSRQMDLEGFLADKGSHCHDWLENPLLFIWGWMNTLYLRVIPFSARYRFGSGLPMAYWVGGDVCPASLNSRNSFIFLGPSLHHYLGSQTWWQCLPNHWRRNTLPQTGLFPNEIMKQTTLATSVLVSLSVTPNQLLLPVLHFLGFLSFLLPQNRVIHCPRPWKSSFLSHW